MRASEGAVRVKVICAGYGTLRAEVVGLGLVAWAGSGNMPSRENEHGELGLGSVVRDSGAVHQYDSYRWK